MEPFEYIDFMTPLREFLAAPSFLAPYERLTIDYMQIDPSNPSEGSAMAVAGMTRPIVERDILGNSVVTESLNLILTMRRHTNDDELRRDIGNFIINFILWVHHENELRGTADQNPNLPKFSDTQTESISASGGMAIGGTAETNLDEFQLQVHITYQKLYESEDY